MEGGEDADNEYAMRQEFVRINTAAEHAEQKAIGRRACSGGGQSNPLSPAQNLKEQTNYFLK